MERTLRGAGERSEANPGWDDPFGAFLAIMMAGSDLKGDSGDGAQGHDVGPSGEVASRSRARWRNFMSRYKLLLTPALAAAPFAIDMPGSEKIEGRWVRPAQFLAFTFPIDLTGQPAAIVPAGWTAHGLPVGN
jgi:aspartyl-tRNA(Asn)/glutamyl-tRNA(Gln) amidotransferase subunit A